MMNYDLIVFDWDGTLMDSEVRIVACVQAAAADMGWPVPPAEEARDIIGLGLQEAVSALWPGMSPAQVNQLADRYRVHFLNDDLAPSALFDGVVQVLDELADREFFLAVATGKSRRGLVKEFERTNLESYFHASRCADETFSKPHPQMLLEILDQLGMEPARTLVVGDTEYDMEMAINAGADAIGVSCGVHTPERLMDNGALACLDNVSGLPGWLNLERQ